MLKPKISDPGVTRHILKAFDLHASKRLGQNFLIHGGTVEAIVETADICPGDRVLETGHRHFNSGPGGGGGQCDGGGIG